MTEIVAEQDRPPRLVAGLGNPGYEYYLTPHNLGFMAADRLAESLGVEILRNEAQSLTAHVSVNGAEVILAKPQTFMNLSGLAISKIMKRYRIPAEGLIVLVDDADIPLGTVRIRSRGTAGGHNGLKSIIGAIGSSYFARIRMGVMPEHRVDDRASYVLNPFRNTSLETVAGMVDRAAEAAGVILHENVETAMNRYNRRATG
jgi:peptidyl-tRNA hydrolase, PTH1 family